METITTKDAQAILTPVIRQFSAYLERARVERPNAIRKVELTAAMLGIERNEANPFEIAMPFTSVYVETATDSQVKVTLYKNEITINGKILKINDSFTTSQPAAKSYLTWIAQPGKTMSLIFLIEDEFKSGSQLSLTAGGVSMTDGDSITPSVVTLVAATATEIVPQDSARKAAIIQNISGASIWLGLVTVTNIGATQGLKILANETIEWRNTCQLYGYSVAGGDVQLTEMF